MVSTLLDMNAVLGAVDFDAACSTRCMGRYTEWLLAQCNDTNAANLARVACLKSEMSRCRNFFPDIDSIHQLVFADTSRDCGANLESVRCTTICNNQLNRLFDTLGCCFESIYNNSAVIRSLSEEGFLLQSQQSALSQFRMSELLTECRPLPVPGACTGNPFVPATGVSPTLPSSSTEATARATDMNAITSDSISIAYSGQALYIVTLNIVASIFHFY
jgi:hypothetical protein